MKNPIKYDTGWRRLDNILAAIAFGSVTLLFAVGAGMLSFFLWAHWQIFK